MFDKAFGCAFDRTRMLGTPSLAEAPAGGHRLFWPLTIPRGVSVLVGHDGTVEQVRYPTQSQCEAAAHVFLGGHIYRDVDPSIVQLLVCTAGIEGCG